MGDEDDRDRLVAEQIMALLQEGTEEGALVTGFAMVIETSEVSGEVLVHGKELFYSKMADHNAEGLLRYGVRCIEADQQRALGDD